jgi:dTDP-4-dehydrorhamnose 3,5-epimerase
MAIEGAWVHTPTRHEDSRGHFEEQFKLSAIEAQLGRTFTVKQVNQSVSAKGVIRGIHFTKSPPGQAKYVSCPNGKLLDLIVDLRPDSSSFLKCIAIELSAFNGRSVLLSEGLGHGFLSLEGDTVAHYLCSSEYNASAETTINPLSGGLGQSIQAEARKRSIDELILSHKDSTAPVSSLLTDAVLDMWSDA